MTVSQPTRGTPALLTHGYTVLAAADGAQALEAADAHAGPIHVLLTDVVMPVWTGWQLAREFRTRRPLTRVLYMTGYAEMPEAPDAPVLQKPFTAFALLQAVREVLDRVDSTPAVGWARETSALTTAHPGGTVAPHGRPARAARG